MWRTAQKHEIPAIAFVNKMDREGADFKHVVGTLERRLGVFPLPLQVRRIAEHETTTANIPTATTTTTTTTTTTAIFVLRGVNKMLDG